IIENPVINSCGHAAGGKSVSAYQGSRVPYFDKIAPAVRPDSPSAGRGRWRWRGNRFFSFAYGLLGRRRWGRWRGRHQTPLNLCEPIVQIKSLDIGSRKTDFKSSCKLFDSWI